MDDWLKAIIRKSEPRVKKPEQEQMLASWTLAMRAIHNKYPDREIKLSRKANLSKAALNDWYQANRYLIIFSSANDNTILWNTVANAQGTHLIRWMQMNNLVVNRTTIQQAQEAYFIDLLTGTLTAYENNALSHEVYEEMYKDFNSIFYLHPQCNSFKTIN